MISTDRAIFEEGSAVRARQAEYAKAWDEVHIVVFCKIRNSNIEIRDKSEIRNSNLPRISDFGFRASESVIAPNCWAYPTRSAFRFLYPFDAIKLGRFIIEKRGITEITTQDASLTAMAGVSLKKQFGLPLEIQIHEDIGSPYYAFNVTNKIRKALALSYIRRADSIRVVSERIKKFLVDSIGVNSSKITVRPIAVDVEWIKNAPIDQHADLHKKYSQFEKIVLMSSRLESEKNIALAIKAWPEVLRSLPKTGLVIVGKGSEREKLEGLVSKSDLNKSIIFEGWAEAPVWVSYFKTADLFLNVSLFEGYGMTLVEAQAAGCKVVSTDVGVARETGAAIVEPNPGSVAAAVIAAIGAL